MSNQHGYKVQCNGNDFIIINSADLKETLDDTSIRRLCDREKGIGADGLLLINLKIDGYDFKMDYYNNDGSWETMCANGALCAINLLQSQAYPFDYNKFLAGDGEHEFNIIDDILSIRMKPPAFTTDDIKVAGHIGAHIDSGAKHFVTQSNINAMDKLHEIAQSIRYDDCFAPVGLNVNFLQINNPHEINVITYEKGIEEIMRSCGSGSVASAFYGAQKESIHSPLTIINPGGQMELIFNDDWSEVWLTSHPTIEFEINP